MVEFKVRTRMEEPTVPTRVAVAGIASNVGKTTLVCRLLERLHDWEAIKVTKGHYRSCGKDPHACCVSHLLTDRPLVLSGRNGTYAAGKDTGRYWDAGAANVHWVVATRKDVADGVREALSRVSPHARGVIVEGTGFLISVPVDLAVMAVPSHQSEIKSSARKTLRHVSYLFHSGEGLPDAALLDALAESVEGAEHGRIKLPPILNGDDFDLLVAAIERREAERSPAVR